MYAIDVFMCVRVCVREKDQFRIYCINDNTLFSPKQKLCDGKDLFWGLQLEETAFAFVFWLGVGGGQFWE